MKITTAATKLCSDDPSSRFCGRTMTNQTFVFLWSEEGNLCHMNHCLSWQFRLLRLETCCLLFCGIVTELCFWVFLAVLLWFGSHFLRVGDGSRGGLWGRERELCNYKIFFDDSVQFAITDWCQCFLLRSTFFPPSNKLPLILPPHLSSTSLLSL